MTMKESKTIINTFREANELKDWLKENREVIAPTALAYATYRIRGLDPTYSIKAVTPKQMREDLDTVGLFNNSTF